MIALHGTRFIGSHTWKLMSSHRFSTRRQMHHLFPLEKGFPKLAERASIAAEEQEAVWDE